MASSLAQYGLKCLEHMFRNFDTVIVKTIVGSKQLWSSLQAHGPRIRMLQIGMRQGLYHVIQYLMSYFGHGLIKKCRADFHVKDESWSLTGIRLLCMVKYRSFLNRNNCWRIQLENRVEQILFRKFRRASASEACSIGKVGSS